MARSKNQRWYLLATVAAGLLLITLDNSILYTALPTLTRELGASPEQALWIINAYPLIMAGLLLGSGTLGDSVGHRKMFCIGLVLFGVASLAAAFSPTATSLIASRAFLAVGAAAMMPATLALIRLEFHDERERNFAIAIWGSLSLVGAALGPLVGGLLLAKFWWGSVFLINVPVVIAALIGTYLFARVDSPLSKAPWDLASSLLALASLSGLVLFIKSLSNFADGAGALAVYLLFAMVAGYLFVRRQSRISHALLDFSIFRNREFSAGVISAAASLFAIAGIELVATQRFQLVADLTPMQAGLLVSALALGCLPTALAAGALLHRVGLRVLTVGGLACASAAVLLSPMMLEYGLLATIPTLIIAGAGLGSVMAVASSAIIGNAPPERAGMAASVEEVSYEFGSLIAVALLGSLLAATYASRLVLPAGVPETLKDAGFASAEEFAATAANSSLMAAASSAFDDGYKLCLYVVGVLLAVAAAACAVLLRRSRQR